MREFDDFLNDKIKTEYEKNIVPSSIDNRIEDTLKNLDTLVNKEVKSQEKKIWSLNRKYISIAAMFVLLLGVGLRVIEPIMNKESVGKNKQNTLRGSEAINGITDGNEKIVDSNRFININKVNSIEVLSSNNDVYKSISDKEKIYLVVNYINSLYINKNENINLNDYGNDYIIKIKAENDIEIIIQKNLVSINGYIYISEYNLEDEFKVIFEQL